MRNPRNIAFIAFLISFIFSAAYSQEDQSSPLKLEKIDNKKADEMKKKDYDNTNEIEKSAAIHYKSFQSVDVTKIQENIQKHSENMNLKKARSKQDEPIKAVDKLAKHEPLIEITDSEGNKYVVEIQSFLNVYPKNHPERQKRLKEGEHLVACNLKGFETQFVLTIDRNGISGRIPILNSKRYLDLIPKGDNTHLLIELTPESTSPRWRNQ